MANRVIKDSIWKSKSLAKLKPYFQDQFTRWLLLADDWGRFNADPEVIRGLVYPKRKESVSKVLSIRSVFYDSGHLFVWDDGEMEWGFFVGWDNHQFVGSLQYDSDGKRIRHRRKTPEPPKHLLDKYLQTNRSSAEQVGAKVPIPIPNPIPNPNPNIVEVIKHLNLKTKKAYSLKPHTSNYELIGARLNEGWTAEQCKRVIDVKCSQWLGDAKWEIYLRPSTLFRKSHFEDYLNEKELCQICKGKGTYIPKGQSYPMTCSCQKVKDLSKNIGGV